MLLHTWYTFLGNSLGNSSGCASIYGFLLFMKNFCLCYFDELGVGLKRRITSFGTIMFFSYWLSYFAPFLGYCSAGYQY